MFSIVIPCYQSAETIRAVVEQTTKEMQKMDRGDLEFVLVNDCSPDNGATISVLRDLAAQYSYVKVIDLAKNVGQHNAMMAGLRAAKGDVFISMDDDMQTRPSELHKMFRQFDMGYDVVYGAYPKKKESIPRRIGSWVNKMCAVMFLGRPKDLKTSSFWIIRRYVRDSIISYQGAHSYLLGLILRVTSNISQVEVEHFERETGQSGYTFKSLLGLWSNMIGFTVKPLRAATYSGTVIAVCSFMAAIVLLIEKLMHPALTAGWASMMIGIFFSMGVELLFLGLIGEYIGRTYMHINSEPQYVIKAQYNIQNEENDEGEEDYIKSSMAKNG